MADSASSSVDPREPSERLLRDLRATSRGTLATRGRTPSRCLWQQRVAEGGAPPVASRSAPAVHTPLALLLGGVRPRARSGSVVVCIADRCRDPGERGVRFRAGTASGARRSSTLGTFAVAVVYVPLLQSVPHCERERRDAPAHGALPVHRVGRGTSSDDGSFAELIARGTRATRPRRGFPRWGVRRSAQTRRLGSFGPCRPRAPTQKMGPTNREVHREHDANFEHLQGDLATHALARKGEPS